MYPDSKLTNKKAIVWLTRIITFILFIVGSFGFGDKVYTGTSIYDFFSGAGVNNWAYEKGGSQPASPTDYTSEALSGDYTNISSSNNVRWDTMLATGNDWDSQIYTFTINEFIDTITSLTFEWEGYGETASGFLTYFYIWNQNSSTWEQLDSQDFISEFDITLTGSTITISNYIDPVTKKLTIMTATQRAKQLGESCILSTECASGYCVDGVCCNGTCGGDCEACNLAGSVGTCTTRGADDNTEVTITCHYCDGINSSSQAYSGNSGVNCINDCTYCSAGTCTNRPVGATDECSTCQACGWGGDCAGITADNGKNCTDDCTHCSDGTCTLRLAQDDTECSTCKTCDGINNTCRNQYSGLEGKNCTAVCKECNGLGNCLTIADNTQDTEGSNTCSATCQACQSGSCSFATTGTDPGENCEPVAYTCYTGNCNGSGACSWYTSGEGNCRGCRTCDGATSASCVDMANNTRDSQGSRLCNSICTACIYDATEIGEEIGCGFIRKGTDPWNECNPGSTASNGCRLGTCSGQGAYCDVVTSGKGNCPGCQECQDHDIACEYMPRGTWDPLDVCPQCTACSGSGGCINTNSGWGEGVYRCTGGNKRCYGGVCRTCQGYLHSDYCGGCAGGLGGQACWYAASPYQSCTEFCGSHGGCIEEQWNDNTICSLCNRITGKQCYPGYNGGVGHAQSWAPDYITTGDVGCHYRYYLSPQQPGIQDCDASLATSYLYRFCVCNY